MGDSITYTYLYGALIALLTSNHNSTENWEFFLKLHFEWRCEHLGQKWNPFSGNKPYKDLTARTKLEILHKLCHWRLELDDTTDLLRVSWLLVAYTCI